MRKRLLVFSVTALGVLLLIPAHASEFDTTEFDKYKVEDVAVSLSTTEAGAHPDFTSSFQISEEKGEPYAFTRDVRLDLPPGLIGNPQGIPACTPQQFGTTFESSECPQDSQVGITEITLGGLNAGTLTEPIYNMATPGGDIVARFGFYAAIYPTIVNVRVNPHEYGITATIEGASATAALLAARSTLWGVPAAKSHDLQRITPEEAINHNAPPGGRESNLPETPFMTNPTDCSTPRTFTTTATSYQLPSSPSSETVPFPQITGCGALHFEPKLSVTPTNPEAAAPTGIDANLEMNQDEAANSRATSALRSAVVTLPEGMAINPAAADGLASCSAAEVGLEENVDAQCPAAAKIGEAEFDVPLLAHPLHGAVYQRTPEGDKLFRFWVVSDELGVHLKLPAEIRLDEGSGQITTLFLGIESLGGNPQVPLADLKLHIDGGPRAPLSTPARCGTYETHYELAPWSGTAPVVGETPMQIGTGCGKGGFAPGLLAGTIHPAAGRYSPFTMDVTRDDGEENPSVLEVTLPQGLVGKIAGVPLCPEQDTATGNCPSSSKIGSVATAAGTGSLPLWIPQPGKPGTAVYLAGPYHSAPYSAVVTVPAQAGPFDLGTVVTRAAIYVDPESARITLKTDPLPQILKGVPVSYRDVRVLTDRPKFTFNPTDCTTKSFQGRFTSITGTVATASSPFQATGCAKLAFSPKLSVSLKGGTRRTQHPALHAVLSQKPGQANIAKTVVTLPHTEFIDNAHLGNPCTRVQFAAEECPKISVLGTVKAFTPILEKPLKGKIYFRSNGGERELPDIVADVKGQNGLEFIQVGYVDSVSERLRTRFLHFPDVPITKVIFDLYGGKRGLLVNSANLCAAPRHVKLALGGQNAKQLNSNPTLKTSCPAHGKR